VVEAVVSQAESVGTVHGAIALENGLKATSWKAFIRAPIISETEFYQRSGYPQTVSRARYEVHELLENHETKRHGHLLCRDA